MTTKQVELSTGRDISYKEWKRRLREENSSTYVKRTINRRSKRLKAILADEHLTWEHSYLDEKRPATREELVTYMQKDIFEKVLEHGSRVIIKTHTGAWYETDLKEGLKNKLKAKEQERDEQDGRPSTRIRRGARRG